MRQETWGERHWGLRSSAMYLAQAMPETNITLCASLKYLRLILLLFQAKREPGQAEK